MKKHFKIKLDSLKEDPKVFYIYDLNGPIYGTTDGEGFLVVTANDYKFEEEESDSICITHFTKDEWFDLVLKCDILPWICACADKKYIIKEHVKLIMETNPYKLRECYNRYNENVFNNLISDSVKDNRLAMWTLIRNTKFINQILVNHKIINLKASVNDFAELLKADSLDFMTAKFTELIYPEIDILKKTTDPLILAEKIKKWEEQRNKQNDNKNN